MALNKPRPSDLAYAFRTFLREGMVWLYDDSERTYPCTATPHIYGVALYEVDVTRAARENERWGPTAPLGDEKIDALFKVSRFKEPAVDGSALVVTVPGDVKECDAWATGVRTAMEQAIDANL